MRGRVAWLMGPRRVEVRETEVPAPGPGEVLLAIEAATTCGTDLKVWKRGGHPTMLTVPGPFGHEMTGVVAAVGRGVKELAEGDRVVVVNSASCGLCPRCRAGKENLCTDLRYLNGAFAEAVLVPGRFVRRSLYRVPEGVAPEVAALTEPLACVLHGLEVAAPEPAAAAVVLGCGPIGLMFVTVLALAGHQVTAVDLNPRRLEVARRLGAVRSVALPPAAEPAEAASVVRAGAGEAPGLAVEATGSPAAWATAMELAAPGGTVLLFGGCPPGTTVPLDTHRLHYSEITVRGAYHHRPATARRALELLAGGGHGLEALLSARVGLDGLEGALEAMERGEVLKAVVVP